MVAMNQTLFVSSHQGGAPKGEFVCVVGDADEQVLESTVFDEPQEMLGDNALP